MKIGIFQDVHANLPAFKEAISFFRDQGCAKIYHVGDLIGIGPYPKEVFDLALSIEELVFIMGNHDHWFAFGLPQPIPAYMSEEEIAHHQWTHQQIGLSKRALAQDWAFEEKLELRNSRGIAFMHYGLDRKAKWFKSFLKTTTVANLDQLFVEESADLIFYGHQHIASDLRGRSRYVNLGSAGCFDKAEVRLGILYISEDGYNLEKYSLPYDDTDFMKAFDLREVPARDFIRANFITRS